MTRWSRALQDATWALARLLLHSAPQATCRGAGSLLTCDSGHPEPLRKLYTAARGGATQFGLHGSAYMVISMGACAVGGQDRQASSVLMQPAGLTYLVSDDGQAWLGP